MIRPGDQAYFDILQTFIGYRTCYYRTFAMWDARRRPQRDAYKRAREWIDAAIALIKPGVATDKSRASGRRPPSSASRTSRVRSAWSSATASAQPFTSGR